MTGSLALVINDLAGLQLLKSFEGFSSLRFLVTFARKLTQYNVCVISEIVGISETSSLYNSINTNELRFTTVLHYSRR